MKVYLVQNCALMPTSSYYDTLEVYATLKDAKALIESLKNDLVAAIDRGHHECFKTGEYKLAFDEDVPRQYDKVSHQMCFYDGDGYYDLYWIEPFNVILK